MIVAYSNMQRQRGADCPSDDARAPSAPQPKVSDLSQLGLISIKVRRAKIAKIARRPAAYTSSDMDLISHSGISEKLLKGQAVSHHTRFGLPRSVLEALLIYV